MPLASRDDVLARYRHLRRLNTHHQTSALKGVSTSALLAQGKRLGLVSGKTFAVDDESDLDFAFDLVLYAAPAAHRSRAIDRYAKAVVRDAGSDEDVLLRAMQEARFSIWRVERHHEIAGLILRDLIHEEEWWLVDEGLEMSASPGLSLALRLFRVPEGFAMTCGTFVPLDAEMVDLVFDQVDHLFDKRGVEAAADRRFAESLYKIALLENEFGEMLWNAA